MKKVLILIVAFVVVTIIVCAVGSRNYTGSTEKDVSIETNKNNVSDNSVTSEEVTSEVTEDTTSQNTANKNNRKKKRKKKDTSLSDEINDLADSFSDAIDDAVGKTVSKHVNKRLKRALDAYEDFVDQYVVIAKKYKKDPTNTELLNEYNTYLKKYNRYVQKVDKWNDGTMSAADTAYYLKVVNRCERKISKVITTFW